MLNQFLLYYKTQGQKCDVGAAALLTGDDEKGHIVLDKEDSMNNKTIKVLIFIVMMIYVVSPDFFPGPIDDIIVLLLGMAAQKKNWLPEEV